MSRRPLLAFLTALCLLIGVIAIPSGPTLVCKLTGEPMKPVMANGAAKRRTCCDVAASTAADGTTRYALTHQGCCDLRQGVKRAANPAIKVPGVEIPTASLAAAPTQPLPLLAMDAPLIAAPREAAPRPPPRLSPASPRAPPAFA